MTYLFDSNIFIESKKNLPMDVWPTFWKRVAELINSRKVFSIDKVKEEINKGQDELTTWIRGNAPKDFFLSQDEAVMHKWAETATWAKSANFTEQAVNGYIQVADSYLVATAAAKNMTLVTYEKSNPQRRNRVMIPDACNAIGAKCCDLNTVFRELGILI